MASLRKGYLNCNQKAERSLIGLRRGWDGAGEEFSRKRSEERA